MSLSKIAVCNLALVNVGADRISSITEDNKRAILLNAIYEIKRDATLRAHPWNFALTRVTLTPNATEPPYEYDYTYDLPSDCLRVLDTDLSDIDYVIEGRTILTNETELNFRYIQRNEDESSWDFCFAEALAWNLAHSVSYALTQSITLRDSCLKAYAKALAEARSMDGAEGILKGLEADDWTNARGR